jgi:hypothetical protein
MSKKRKEKFGVSAWYVRRKGINCQGKPSLESRFGPFASYKAAGSWREDDEERPGEPGYEYEYEIYSEPIALRETK